MGIRGEEREREREGGRREREFMTGDKCYTATAVVNKTSLSRPQVCYGRHTVLTFVKFDTVNIYIFKLQNLNMHLMTVIHLKC